jgi:hypothetical protein
LEHMTHAYTHIHGSYTPYMIRHQFIRVERWRNPEFFFFPSRPLLCRGEAQPLPTHIKTPYSTPSLPSNRQIRDTHTDRTKAFEHSDAQTKTHPDRAAAWFWGSWKTRFCIVSGERRPAGPASPSCPPDIVMPPRHRRGPL